jgi:uncharacterized membrane protein HdeD (DUF308 family)
VASYVAVAATVPPADQVPAIARAGRFWWVALVVGILSVVVGFAALFFPEPTLLAVGIIFGAYLVLWSAMVLMRGVADKEEDTVLRVLRVIAGVIGVIVGLVLLVRPGQSVLTAAFVLGFWWVVIGILQLSNGIAVSEHRVWNIGWGVLGLVAGTIILVQPGIGLITLVWIVSLGLIFQGLMEIGMALEMRRIAKSGDLL